MGARAGTRPHRQASPRFAVVAVGRSLNLAWKHWVGAQRSERATRIEHPSSSRSTISVSPSASRGPRSGRRPEWKTRRTHCSEYSTSTCPHFMERGRARSGGFRRRSCVVLPTRACLRGRCLGYQTPRLASMTPCPLMPRKTNDDLPSVVRRPLTYASSPHLSRTSATAQA